MNNLYFQSTKTTARFFFLLALFILTTSLQSKASWTQTGPEAGSFFIKENNGVLYSTNAIGLYKSTDNGVNWARVSTFAGFTMNDLVFTPNKMIASTNKGIFYSIDGGVNWVSSNQGMTNADTTNAGTSFIFVANNSRLITSVISGTYYSDNYGQNWVLSSGSSQFIAICKQGSLIFSIGFSDIYKSADNGQTWIISSNNGFNATDLTIMKKIYNINNVLIIGCNSISVYTSSDSGQNWLLASTGITGTPQAGGIYYFNNLVYKKTSNGYFVLNETTGLWSQSNITQTNDIGILGYNTGRYFGVNSILYDGLVYTDNNGLTWQNCNGVKCMNIRKLSSSENLYSLYDAGGYLFDSTQTIFNRTTPFNQNYSANTYFQSGVFDIKKRSNGTIYLATAGGVWKSTNNG
ncbi:MAG: hypothetical protein ACK5D8_07415, partial [Bacteroidota bacterium]